MLCTKFIRITLYTKTVTKWPVKSRHDLIEHVILSNLDSKINNSNVM